MGGACLSINLAVFSVNLCCVPSDLHQRSTRFPCFQVVNDEELWKTMINYNKPWDLGVPIVGHTHMRTGQRSKKARDFWRTTDCWSSLDRIALDLRDRLTWFEQTRYGATSGPAEVFTNAGKSLVWDCLFWRTNYSNALFTGRQQNNAHKVHDSCNSNHWKSITHIWKEYTCACHGARCESLMSLPCVVQCHQCHSLPCLHFLRRHAENLKPAKCVTIRAALQISSWLNSG